MIAVRPWRSCLRRAVTGALVAWVVVATVMLVLARRDALVGERVVASARTALAPASLSGGSTERELLRASKAFRSARARLRHPLLLPVRLVPVVGRQVRVAAAIAGAGGQVTAVGATATRQVRLALTDPPRSGAERLAALELLSKATEDAERAVRQVRLAPGDGLVGPVADARERFARELGRAQSELRRAVTVTGGLVEFLRGPRRYLLLAANNTEMRAGSGMFLSAGILTVVNGELRLPDMRSMGELRIPGDGVAVEGDQAARWGWTNPGREWRNLSMTPRFDATAPLAARMWQAKTGEAVDGVMSLDVVALRAVLAATGPIHAGGLDVGADNIERHLFHDQYLGLDVGLTVDPAQVVRRDQLSEIAQAAVALVQAGGVELPALAEGLAKAAMGRHLLLWSRRAPEQSAWEAADVSGKMASNSVLLSVLNRGGNKLDQYLQVDARIASRRRSDRGHDVVITVRLLNAAPEFDAPYIVGPYPGLGVSAGTYVGLFAATIPGDAQDLAFGGAVPTSVRGPDGPTQVIATEVRLARGEESVLVVRFHLPAARRTLVVEPSARVPPIRWHVGSRTWDDEQRRTIEPLE